MSLAPEIFREVMGRLAGGVTIVTARDAAGEPRGFTATAVCSVSLEPPLVLVCVGRDAQTLPAIRASGGYVLNFLHSGDARRAERFAGSDESKFEGTEWIPASGGAPVLQGSLAWVECAVERELQAGDHAIFIGRVTDGRLELPEAAPLVHFGRRYQAVAAIEE